MKSFQSLASTLYQGVQNTYSAYNRGYQHEAPAEDDATAILEEDERNRRLTDVKGEEGKEALAAQTSVMFQNAAIPHESMASVVEKAREQRVAALGEDVQHAQSTVATPGLTSLVEDERERRISDEVEAKSRQAVAAQITVLLKDAVSTGKAPSGEPDVITHIDDQSLVEEERARRIANIQEAHTREALAAKTSILIQNQSVKAPEEHTPTREISKLIAAEAQKQHLLDTDALMTPSLVNTSVPRMDANQIHPGMETPLVLRDDTPMEVRREQSVINEVAVRDPCPVVGHEESHIVAPTSLIESLPVVAQVSQIPSEASVPQFASNEVAQPQAAFQGQPEHQAVPQLETAALHQLEIVNQAQPNNMQAFSEIQSRSIPTPAHVEYHNAIPSVQLYPMVVQQVGTSNNQATTVATGDLTRYLMPTIETNQAPGPSQLPVQQFVPVSAAPVSAPSVHASSLAMLQADAMEQTDSAPSTEWVESRGQPTMVSNAPIVPVLLKSLSAKDIRQINRNINANHYDALKEVRRAEKCLAKVEKYTAKGNTSKAEKYQKEYMDHKSRAAQHEHIVVEEKAKMGATPMPATTPAL